MILPDSYNAALYTIEFQKMGLPHAHMILFLHSESKLPNHDDIDRIISTEIPDKVLEAELYVVVGDTVVHGPCGAINRECVCMKDGKCTKFFPKDFNDSTRIDGSGFPIYKRLNDGRFVEKKGFKCDSRYIVPYNKYLSLTYRAHINVEWCVQMRSVKYLFKYTKGPDYLRAGVGTDKNDGTPVDEVKKYFTARYLSAYESAWRILSFSTQKRTTPVEKLSFHLPDNQSVLYTEDEPIDDILIRASVGQTKVLAWMDCNNIYPEARLLTYVDFPTKFVWNLREKNWSLRKRGFAIGRITYVPQHLGEIYYLRMLLNLVKGPRSYEEIRTVDGIEHSTFQDACFALGLLDDDGEYITAIEEASWYSSGKFLRKLFAMLLFQKCIVMPLKVWEATWQYLTDDVQYSVRRDTNQPGNS